jgi:hypothetical protein
MGKTERLRDKTADGFYYSAPTKDSDGFVYLDNTVGEALSPLTGVGLEDAIHNLEPGVITAVGSPLWGSRRAEIERLLRGAADHGHSTAVIARPLGRGFHRLCEEIYYLCPLGSDVQHPRRREIREAVQVTLITNLSVVILAFKTSPVRIAAPVIFALASANFVLNCYRRSVSNWMNRSLGRPLEKFGKELVIAGTMAALIYMVARWEQVAAAFASHGVTAFLHFPYAICVFWSTEWQTVLTYGLFFAFTSNGIYRWDQIRSVTPEGNEEVLRTLPVLFTLLLAAANPLLSWASTSQTLVYSSSWLKLNQGDVALIIFGAGGGVLWACPQLLNHAPPLIAAVRGFFRQRRIS